MCEKYPIAAMGDTKMLIYAIEKYPCLWDLKNEDYHNRDVKYLAWEQVCKEIISDFSSNNSTEKLNKCAEIKKKWTHIRDYFRKDLHKVKNTHTGSAAKTQKRYIYADMLQFLEPVFERRSSQGNYQDDSQDEVESHNDLSPVQEEINAVQEERTVMKSPPPCIVSTSQKKKDVPTQILSMLQKREQAQVKTPTDEDDDTKFLLSFRGEMKKMNDNQKLDFKIGMLQLVKTIHHHLYVSTSPSTSHTYSHSPMSSPSPNFPYQRTSVPQHSMYDNQSRNNFHNPHSMGVVHSVTPATPFPSTGRESFQLPQFGEEIDEPIETYLKLK